MHTSTAAVAAVAAEYLTARQLYSQTRTQLAPVRAAYSQQLRSHPDKYPPCDLGRQLDAMEHGAELLRRQLIAARPRPLPSALSAGTSTRPPHGHNSQKGRSHRPRPSLLVFAQCPQLLRVKLVAHGI